MACRFLLLLLAFYSLSASAQKVELLTSGTKTSIRGLSVVNDEVVWASGSNGMVGRSTDAGKTWQWTTVKGFEKREFRDIEAFDANTAVIIAIAEPANILKTTDGGATWKVVFTDTAKGMFLDALDFADPLHGVVIGDPIGRHIYRVYTNDQGNTWVRPADDTAYLPAAREGEAMFAASGSNVVFFEQKKNHAHNSMYIVTGGTHSRLLSQGPIIEKTIPIIQGKESTGANSIAALSRKKFIIVGGDFSNDKDSTRNCALSNDGGNTWISPNSPPHGYRSCVEYINAKDLVCCGTSGVDISSDGGLNWQLISPDGFHVCRKAKKGKTVFLAGGNGKIARLVR